MKIYLAGSIYLVDYRKYVKETYHNICGFEIFDPLDYEEWETEENGEHQRIINTDMWLLNECHVLIADVSLGPTFGTVSEIALMKHLFRKPVFTFNIPYNYKNNPWLIGQSDKTFVHVDECFEYLKNLGLNSKSVNRRLYYQTKS